VAWCGVHMGAQIELSERYCSVRVQINVIGVLMNVIRVLIIAIRALITVIRVLINVIRVLIMAIRVLINVIRVLIMAIRVFPSAAHDGHQPTACDTRCNATDDGADVAALDLEPVQYRTAQRSLPPEVTGGPCPSLVCVIYPPRSHSLTLPLPWSVSERPRRR
jgi:hypothetical protein